MGKIVVLEGQTLIDLAIQQCGSVEAAFQLAVENDLSVTDELSAGLELSSIDPVERPVAQYYEAKRLKPATSDLLESEVDPNRIFDLELPIEFS